MTDDRKAAERKVGLARLWARAKQIVTTDPTGSDEDDHVVDEEAARVLARAGRPAQGRARQGRAARRLRSGRDARPRRAARRAAARAVLGGLWDHAPAVSARRDRDA